MSAAELTSKSESRRRATKFPNWDPEELLRCNYPDFLTGRRDREGRFGKDIQLGMEPIMVFWLRTNPVAPVLLRRLVFGVSEIVSAKFARFQS